MRYSAIVVLVAFLGVGTPAALAQPANLALSPYTPQEAAVLSYVWPRIRGAKNYEDINWQALGVPGEPGSVDARRLIAQHWKELRGAANFTDINWYVTTGYTGTTAAANSPPAGTAPPPAPTPTTARVPPAPAPNRNAAPTAPPSAAEPGAFAGTWVGTLETYPSFFRLTLDLPAAASATAPVQGTLRVDGGLTAQGGTSGQIPVTAQLNPAARALTLTLGNEARPLRLPVGELYGFLDAQGETIAGLIGNAPADATPFFVLTRQRGADDHVFNPIAAAQTRPGGANPLAAFRQMRGGTSRGDLERWVQPLVAEYAGAEPYPNEQQVYVMARGLFADEYFEPSFGTTFDRMDAGDLERVRKGLQEIPLPRTTGPADRPAGILKTVERSFLNIVGTGTASDMVLSTIAMRHLAAWRAGTRAQLGALGNTLDAFRTAGALDEAAVRLSPYLWPSQRAELGAAVVASRGRAARAPLIAEVDRLLASSTGLAGARALDTALKIAPDKNPQPALERAVRAQRVPTFAMPAPAAVGGDTVSLAELAQWAPAEWDTQKPRLNAGLDSLLTKTLAEARTTLGLPAGGAVAAAANPTARLAAGKAWYERNRELFERFANRSVVASFLNDFGAQREADFAAALPQMSARLAAFASAAEVQRFSGEVAIDLDRDRSPSWRTLESQRDARLATLDREARAARVGPGPFGPDYPGAAYLNALYRNDRARLAQEDRAVSEPLANTMTQMLQATGIDALTSALSGGVVPPGGLTQLMTNEMRSYSIADPLAGFFIVAYERVYPKCMDPNPVTFVETITWDTVVTNGFGTEVARYPHSETNYYTVNKRHAAAFEQLGTGPNPDEIDFTTALFGAFLPQGLTQPFRTVSESLHGLRLAMTENRCDSELIRTLEKNMIAHAMGQ